MPDYFVPYHRHPQNLIQSFPVLAHDASALIQEPVEHRELSHRTYTGTQALPADHDVYQAQNSGSDSQGTRICGVLMSSRINTAVLPLAKPVLNLIPTPSARPAEGNMPYVQAVPETRPRGRVMRNGKPCGACQSRKKRVRATKHFACTKCSSFRLSYSASNSMNTYAPSASPRAGLSALRTSASRTTATFLRTSA